MKYGMAGMAQIDWEMVRGLHTMVTGELFDGPEFDAHDVDFNVLMQRNSMYREQEQKSLAEFECEAEKQVKQVRESIRAAEAVK